MSGGGARAAIRSLLRVPRPGRRWPAWLWVVSVALPPAPVAKLVGRLWTWIALAAGLGLALGLVPLVGVLGFELALVCALFAAVMGLDVGSALARELQRQPAEGIARATYAGRTLARSTLAAGGLAAGIVAIPAVIAAIRGMWVPTCDWAFGIWAFLLMPATTAVLAGATGHAIGVIAGPRRFLGAALAQLPLVLVAAAALHRFYSAPPVFTYNAVLGYFPGNLYDENVELGAALLWSRLEQALWVTALVALVAANLDVPRFRITREPRPVGRRIGAIVLALVCVAGGVVLRTQSGALGYAVDAEDIEAALEGRIETPHFVIHYAKTEDIEEVIALVAADHEFRYQQVTRQIGATSSRKIRSFYFANREQKARWIGARNVEMAKPWRREIYLEHRAFPHTSLRHEIAHAVAAEFGDPMFGVAARHVLGVPVYFSPGLVEGLAVALDWPGEAGYQRLTPHEAVRALQGLGAKPSIRSLLSLEFFRFSSAAGYTTAGSFLRYLLDEYGAEKLRAMYGSGGDFEGVYGKPLAALERDWLAMLEEVEIPSTAVEASRERFRVGSVFERPCPHAIAKRHEEAREALGRGDRPRAVELMRSVCSDAPEEPRHLLTLATMLAAGDADEREEALRHWSSLAFDAEHVTSTIRAAALQRLAREAAARGAVDRARELVRLAVPLHLEAGERRQVDAFAFALDHTGPAAEALRGYFFDGVDVMRASEWAELATLAEPGLGFAHYLLGLQRVAQGKMAEAAASLEQAIARGLPGLPFVKNAARQLAVSAFRSGDIRRVELAIAVLSGSQMSAGDRLLARDWFERLGFAASR